MARVLVNHVSSIPNKVTGLSVYTWKILEALARYGDNEYVLATNWQLVALPREIVALNLPMVSHRLPRNELAALTVSTAVLPDLRRRHGCDLIFHPQPTAMLAGMSSSVVVLHDLYRVTHPDQYSLARRLQWRFGTARGFRQAAGIIAVSHATRTAAEAVYPDCRGRITVVHEASPVEADPAAGRKPVAGGDTPFLLSVANVTPNKNIELIFAALDQLAGDGITPELRLVGRDDAGLLPDLFRRFPGARVKPTGSVSDDALAALYRGAQAYVNTSLVEGFCLPILEAQTHGVAVICSDIPVLREVAGRGALLIDPRSPDSLAAALRQVVTNPGATSTLRQAARDNVARFSWAKAARETEAVLQAVLDRRNGA